MSMDRATLDSLRAGDLVEVCRDGRWLAGIVAGRNTRGLKGPIVRFRPWRSRRERELEWDDPGSIKRQND